MTDIATGGAVQLRARKLLADISNWLLTSFQKLFRHKRPKRPTLRYFDEILKDERSRINDKRKERRPPLGNPEPLPIESAPAEAVEYGHSRPDYYRIHLEKPPLDDVRKGGPRPPDPARSRPKPDPCNATGISLSGGGIRSAAFCLGALQALETHDVISRVDYLSTVSGGGYIGASMTAAMSRGSAAGAFPFQNRGDPSDTLAVGHIRNFSNYLMPRGRSFVRNVSEGTAIILRGLVANGVQVAGVLIGMALLTRTAYPDAASLSTGSFVPRLADAALNYAHKNRYATVNAFVGQHPFALTVWMLALLALLLLLWALQRSLLQRFDYFAGAVNDTSSPHLRTTSIVFGLTVICGVLDLAPVMVGGLAHLYHQARGISGTSVASSIAALTALVGAVGGFGDTLGHFFKVTPRPSRWSWFWRVGLIWLAALALPVILLVVYLHLSAWMIPDFEKVVPRPIGLAWPLEYYLVSFAVFFILTIIFEPNAYSLHQFYRDRLSKAFLFNPNQQSGIDLEQLDTFKLSDICANASPYHIVNTALNVHGSKEANRRGRNADFFIFTKDYVGSDLTLYASTNEQTYVNTHDMEDIDPSLNLASAMAISGAAVAANMGSATIGPLSPTLALLNVRLGYWLRNPRDIAKERLPSSVLSSPRTLLRVLGDIGHVLFNRFYLLLEMANALDEQSRRILLTDGGHIENLGIYELLKRGCQLIIAVDAEADPTMSFIALNKLERYARIDFGIRIDLPWEDIAQSSEQADKSLRLGKGRWNNSAGPHCAIGRILYANGSEGLLIYIKSSLSGDEPDYVLDYKRRNLSFPHETTGDQFFSEEQFEAYRALGFHAVDHCWNGADTIMVSRDLEARGATPKRLIDWIRTILLAQAGVADVNAAKEPA